MYAPTARTTATRERERMAYDREVVHSILDEAFHCAAGFVVDGEPLTCELVKQHALAVYQQASVLKLMPLNNATQITDDERALIKRWFEAGAPTK